MRLLILSVRGLRLDCLGCYGNDWIDTPTLDKLAAESVVFDQHYAEQPDLVGAYPEILTDANVETRLIADADHGPPLGFARSFTKSLRIEGGPTPGDSLEPMLDAARKAAASLNRRERALLWVDLPAVLPPWDIPAEFLEPYFSDTTDQEKQEEPLLPWTGPVPAVVAPDDETTLLRLQRTYAAAVTRLDTHLGRLLEGMREKGWLQDWLIVLTAPYGLPLGDHGIVGFHCPWLHEELVHLPLLIRLPGGAEAGRRVASMTQGIDVPATLLDTLAVPLASVHGHSLLPLCRGEMKSVRIEVLSALRTRDAEEWALRTSGWSYLLPVSVPPSDPPRRPQLYVKPDDRHEVNNVVQHHLELAEEMERKLRDSRTAES